MTRKIKRKRIGAVHTIKNRKADELEYYIAKGEPAPKHPINLGEKSAEAISRLIDKGHKCVQRTRFDGEKYWMIDGKMRQPTEIMEMAGMVRK